MYRRVSASSVERRVKRCVTAIGEPSQRSKNMSTKSTVVQSANIMDEETGAAFVVLSFPRIDGRTGTVTVPRSDLLDPVKLRIKLVDRNADLDLTAKGAHELDGIINAKPLEHGVYVANAGWHPSRKGFIAATGIISKLQPRVKFLPPRGRPDATMPPRTRSGTLAGWKQEVGRPCCLSDLGVLALSTAFAAPLLRLMGRPSFGLNLFGPSKAGKSALLLATASVSGAGYEFDLPNWGATDAAVGELCRFYNDDMLPLNEAGLMSGSPTQVFDRIRKTIFHVSEGRERQKHSGSPFATSAKQATYSLIFLSTAERSFTEYARAAGVDRVGGELARCPDISILRDGCETIFDIYPSHVPIHRRRAWARRQLQLIRQGCAIHHGFAQKAFILFLLSDLDGCLDRVEAACRRFLATLGNRRLSDVHQHRAANFALLYAANVLAIETGILDIDEDRALRCVRQHLLASIASETGAGAHPSVEDDVGHLVDFLNTDRIAGAGVPAHRIGDDDYDGYRRADGDVVMKAASLRQLYKNRPASARAVLAYLKEHDLVIPPDTRSAGQRPLQGTKLWPNGKTVRSFVLSRRLLEVRQMKRIA